MAALHRHTYALAMLMVATLHCAARQVRTEPELEEAVRRAKADEEKGWQALGRTIRPKDEEADLEMQRRAVAELGKIPSPRAQKMLGEAATDRYLRGEAVQALLQQRNDANKTEMDRMIVEAARSNALEFGGLSKEEIRALGEIDDPEAVRLLRQQLGRDPAKDDLVVEALGKILRRQKRSQGRTAAVLAGGVQLEIEDISTSKSKEETPPTIPATTTQDETDPEKVLLDFLATDAASETKDKAIQSIADAHGGNNAYLLSLAANNNLAAAVRIAIIDYLTRDAVNREDKSIIAELAALKRRSRNREVNASIDLSLRVLARAFGAPVATGGIRARRIAITEGYDPLPKEADIITLKQRPYPEYSAADVKTNLKKALRHYQLDAGLVERMQRRVNELMNLPENRQSSERNLIFAALGRLYPQRDFYVLKEQSKDAFSKPGYFTTTLRLITSSARGRSWQIAVLQRIWGLSYSEADMLRQIYLRDGKLLQQRMRL